MASPEPTTTARTPSRGRAVAIVLAVVIGCGVAWTIGRDLLRIGTDGYHTLGRPAPRIADADLDPLAYFGSTRAFSGARAVIPPGQSYTLVTGQTKPPFASLPGPATKIDPATLRLAFALWLIPRPYVPLSKAQWVIAYDVPPGSLGVRASDTVNLGPDATVIKVWGR